MGKATGFMDYKRQNGPVREPSERISDYVEFHGSLSLKEQSIQGARCMACGVPFCQAGVMIAGMASGCPLHNLVPEMNHLVSQGNWEQAYSRLSKTHSFPEFTSRVCPALCEAACTCGLHDEPVSTKENERAVIEYAYEHGLVDAGTPKNRTGKRVAVIGSGPSGLAAADRLNRRGHLVTVFERSDRPGGLLRYGIPNMKLDKRIIDRRIALMNQAGIMFRCNVNVGQDFDAKELLGQFDRVILCCGASNPRDIMALGRDAKGIYYAVDFLKEVSRKLMDSDYDAAKVTAASDYSFGRVKGKHVIVIGGGDTGNDCVGTSIRLGAASVVQLEMMPKPAEERMPGNPWPEWPKVLKTDYGQKEAIMMAQKDPRIYQTTVQEFIKDAKGHLKAVRVVSLKSVQDSKTGRFSMVPVEGSEKELRAELVLIAAGFLGSEAYVTKAFHVETNARTNVKTAENEYQTSEAKVFTAGDMHRGQSLVVWAIAEGRAVAKAVDESLMGYTNL